MFLFLPVFLERVMTWEMRFTTQLSWNSKNLAEKNLAKDAQILSQNAINCLTPFAIQKPGFDLGMASVFLLNSLGVTSKNITWFAENTFTSKMYPSYRRSVGLGLPSDARIETTLIALEH
jgi:hypothetical protein